MQNPRLASRYAKSLKDLAVERDQLEAVHSDMLLLKAITRSNADVVVLLRSPVIKADKKIKILGAILDGKISAITTGFIRLLNTKGRESLLPEIAVEFEKQYNILKNITRVKLTSAAPLEAGQLNMIREKVEASAGRKVEIETAVNPDLIGGFVLETGNELFDASIQRDLKDIKKQFLKNIYVPELR
ncbi:ATP synthase F1 subunit delta [Chitinophaga sp. XS-30]|uniref:ATP synthase F1 subunit delta n=1 Tax=Chitinophaga sp. XS-30 TaxID=2604421 RepID=UPI0011DE3E80|nr:ATP synthase F1 subunit delta [Chitinophaga sp. XS-30]QEH40559.1 ATP synthase F1 subunit delta [Chitinophaga sp. XS-30]